MRVCVICVINAIFVLEILTYTSVSCFDIYAMVRYELFSKSDADLRSIIPLLKQNSITKVNLPNKCKSDNTNHFLDILKQEMPDIDICMHWSVKYQKLKTVDETHACFTALCNSNSDRLLVVSGSRPSKSCDTLTCLKYLSSSGKKSICPLGVAFNPYFPSLEERRIEEDRLVSKLKTGLVSSVWLQCGSNVLALESGLSFLKNLQDSGFRFEVVGSLLIPSRRLLAQMKFRPWNGVFLSQEYLSSVDSANAITRQIASLYSASGVEPLIETACATQTDLDRVADILGPAATTGPSYPLGESARPSVKSGEPVGPAAAQPQAAGAKRRRPARPSTGPPPAARRSEDAAVEGAGGAGARERR